MIIDQLRSATRQAHQDLDHLVYPLISNTRQPGEYCKLLATFYGFFKPVHDNLDQFLDSTIIPDYHQRRKPARLLQDISHFSTDKSEPAYCQDIPAITDSAEAFGVIYVLEGSTLGGSVISKKIAENLGLSDSNALSFYAGYGEQNKEMWNLFLTFLELHPSNVVYTTRLLQSAETTFIKFKNWISLSYASNTPTH